MTAAPLYPDLPENALLVLIGASGAGKSTLAATWPPSQVVSLDHLREVMSDSFSVKFSVLQAATSRPLFRPGLRASTATVGHHRGMRGHYPPTTDVTAPPRGRRLSGQRAALRCCRRSGGRPQPSRAGSSRRHVG